MKPAKKRHLTADEYRRYRVMASQHALALVRGARDEAPVMVAHPQMPGEGVQNWIVKQAWREWRDARAHHFRGEVWPTMAPSYFILDELGFRVGDISIRATLERLAETNAKNRREFAEWEAREARAAAPIRVPKRVCTRCAAPPEYNELCERCYFKERRTDNIDSAAYGPDRGVVDCEGDPDGVHRQMVTRELYPPDEIDWDLPNAGRHELTDGRVRNYTEIERATARGIVDGQTDRAIAKRVGASARGVGKARARLLGDGK